ncbi:GFA family protein [Paracoccus tegillarcae]|uniref:Aldehyde-activating protein n=1 Tax=Paracoccus tegillarcae TaxID=1529068 RepID=A0A2K9EHE8_9RHOB|nr:GFA family protein [Paracoccus tegillarcae]AUH34390.1 aldehyde-activating protein [Paracoccus tegillarcae]
MCTTGECECGEIGYSVTEDGPIHVYACHCLNCQTRSGSAFGEHALVAASDFDCKGETVTHDRHCDGIDFQEVFCANCRTRIFNRNSAMPDMIFLRAGTLNDSQRLNPIAHIWTKRKQLWLLLPDGIPQFDESPTPEEFGQAVQAALRRGSDGI